MKLLTSKVFWGLILVLGGILLLLQQLGVVEGSEVFWMAACAVAGVLFLIALIANREAWWAVIPGFSLIAVALGVALETFSSAPGEIVGAVILGGIGLSFLVVYLIQRMHWWAIIPGGVLITLAVVSALEGAEAGSVSGAIFFAGLGLTFILVALLPNKTGRMVWAWIPGGILLGIALLVLAGIEDLMKYIWPSVLIAAGLFFVLRALIKNKEK